MSIIDPQSHRQALDDLWANGPDTGWRCGWAHLDELYRPTRGQLSVITGIPGAGKTTFTNAYLARLAARHDHRFMFFSPEQTGHKRQPMAKHIRNLSVVHGGRNMSREQYDAAEAWVFDHFAWINHHEVSRLSHVTAAADESHQVRPFDGLVIDPWNWIEDTRPSHMSETQFVGQALNYLVRFAQTLDVHVWVVAHPRKMEVDARTGQYHVARPYDIAGSGNWFNKPWFVISLWRDHLRDMNTLDVHVQKVRDDDQGRVGKAELVFNRATRNYSAMPKPEYEVFGG